MIKIGISMIKNWYSNYLYFNDQHFKKPMVPFVSWSLLSLGPFCPLVPFGHGPFWVLVPFGWSLLAGPFWPVPFGLVPFDPQSYDEHYFAKTRRRVKDQGQKLTDPLSSNQQQIDLKIPFINMLSIYN